MPNLRSESLEAGFDSLANHRPLEFSKGASYLENELAHARDISQPYSAARDRGLMTEHGPASVASMAPKFAAGGNPATTFYGEVDHVDFKVAGLAYYYDDASLDGLRSLSSGHCKRCHVLCAVKRGNSRRTP